MTNIDRTDLGSNILSFEYEFIHSNNKKQSIRQHQSCMFDKIEMFYSNFMTRVQHFFFFFLARKNTVSL